MKASELIEKLQELVDEHGDKDVKTEWDGFMSDAGNPEYIESEDSIHI